jgi:hypothetical protein
LPPAANATEVKARIAELKIDNFGEIIFMNFL